MADMCTLPKNITLFERKITMKGLIFVYFQCDFWILHLKNYLDTKFFPEVTSIDISILTGFGKNLRWCGVMTLVIWHVLTHK